MLKMDIVRYIEKNINQDILKKWIELLESTTKILYNSLEIFYKRIVPNSAIAYKSKGIKLHIIN